MQTAPLLAWYATHRRPLPWRTEVSAYRTLVSELMCQQTRIETVLPYFARFMNAFPTVEALALAPTERVLERWSGLGYYSRARNLQKAAQAVVAAGGFPRTGEGLRALPGVGPYTAGAIGSIAFGLDLPVVDGNVERVFARWYAQARPQKAWLWQTAAALLPAGQAGAWNQALMELGSQVCTPRSPRCVVCPVRQGCSGSDAPELYPAPKEKKAVPRALAVAGWWVRNGSVLLARRPESGLLAGLWELPGGEVAAMDAPALSEVLRRRLGVSASGCGPLGAVTHRFTHLHLETTVFSVSAVGEPVAQGYPELRWVPLGEVDAMALSTSSRKTVSLALRASPGVSDPVSS
ncbi:MAG: A/G-specific adenine glycosylase [Myxococcales bacterium]|nr:A/G-specific adenine glycosylase [Myxococcales bacterium]